MSRGLLGDIFLRYGWFEAAYRQYGDLIQVAPDDALAVIRLARAAAGAGRVDEGLRLLRRVASGEGRPGVADPRRFARLHAAVLLAGLVIGATAEVAGPERELRRLGLFETPGIWSLLVWQDLEARLVLAGEGEAPLSQGETVDAGTTGMYAFQVATGDPLSLTARHAGDRLDRPVAWALLTVLWDGAKFTISRREGNVPARASASGTVTATPRSPAPGVGARGIEPPSPL